MVKPGYKTSEFWFTLVSFIFSGLFLLGFIGDSNQKEELIRDVSHGVESIMLIGGQLLILYNYINSRKEIKKKSQDLQASESTSNTTRPSNTKNKRKSTSHKKSSS